MAHIERTSEPRRRAPRVLAALGVLMLLASCDGGDGGGDGGVDTLAGRKREILGAVGENVVLPTLREAVTAADALESAAQAHAADPSEANRMAAQAAFTDAMAVWQRAELMQLGPAGMGGAEGAVAGGMDLRDEIYSWDATSTCRIDQETVEDAHADPEAFASEVVNVRGLDALEYLLFVESPENTCTALSPINEEGTWDALSEDAIRQRRATYAHTVAVLVAQQAARLLDAWEPSGGGFVGELRTAGDGSELFSSAQQGLNDLAGAMLYLDTQTRDMKLAVPAGISADCTSETCVDDLEAPFSGTSKDHVLANLRAFQALYLGGPPETEALGIDDLLVDVGSEMLATQLAEAIAAAITAVEAIDGTLRAAIEAGDPDGAVMDAYAAIGEAQRLFKVDVVTALDIEPTGFGRVGDND
ncbi:MAG TPA: imelysin family protein [Sandaracinaceae bacterium LLY-WYZ-13_1]|nr:imelysin family protein [Sandaracinaceae bacterium LLY-WYZ-13_1]